MIHENETQKTTFGRNNIVVEQAESATREGKNRNELEKMDVPVKHPQSRIKCRMSYSRKKAKCLKMANDVDEDNSTFPEDESQIKSNDKTDRLQHPAHSMVPEAKKTSRVVHYRASNNLNIDITNHNVDTVETENDPETNDALKDSDMSRVHLQSKRKSNMVHNRNTKKLKNGSTDNNTVLAKENATENGPHINILPTDIANSSVDPLSRSLNIDISNIVEQANPTIEECGTRNRSKKNLARDDVGSKSQTLLRSKRKSKIISDRKTKKRDASNVVELNNSQESPFIPEKTLLLKHSSKTKNLKMIRNQNNFKVDGRTKVRKAVNTAGHKGDAQNGREKKSRLLKDSEKCPPSTQSRTFGNQNTENSEVGQKNNDANISRECHDNDHEQNCVFRNGSDDSFAQVNTSKTIKAGKAVNCNVCSESFSSKETMMDHSSSREMPYGCPMCGEQFEDATGLGNHSSEHEMNGRFLCVECGRGFYQQNNLSVHMQTHKADTTLKCKEPPPSVQTSKPTSKQNGKSKHRELPFQCDTCSMQFVSKRKLCVHSKSHEKMNFVCERCGKAFSRLAKYEQHVKTHDANRLACTCNLCERQFKEMHNLNMHLRTHTGEKPYHCAVCDKSFSQLGNYETHRRIHSGERPFSCTTCGATFTTSGNRDAHCRTHTGEKPYMCEFCGVSFARPNSLKMHRNLHIGVRPYKCDQCDKAFVSSGKLVDHKRTHSGEKPYTCETCGRCFAIVNTYNRHRKKHSGVKPHSCSYCGKRFTRLDGLRSHLKSHTQQNVQTVSSTAQKRSVSSKKAKTKADGDNNYLTVSETLSNATSKEWNQENCNSYDANLLIPVRCNVLDSISKSPGGSENIGIIHQLETSSVSSNVYIAQDINNVKQIPYGHLVNDEDKQSYISNGSHDTYRSHGQEISDYFYFPTRTDSTLVSTEGTAKTDVYQPQSNFIRYESRGDQLPTVNHPQEVFQESLHMIAQHSFNAFHPSAKDGPGVSSLPSPLPNNQCQILNTSSIDRSKILTSHLQTFSTELSQLAPLSEVETNGSNSPQEHTNLTAIHDSPIYQSYSRSVQSPSIDALKNGHNFTSQPFFHFPSSQFVHSQLLASETLSITESPDKPFSPASSFNDGHNHPVYPTALPSIALPLESVYAQLTAPALSTYIESMQAPQEAFPSAPVEIPLPFGHRGRGDGLLSSNPGQMPGLFSANNCETNSTNFAEREVPHSLSAAHIVPPGSHVKNFERYKADGNIEHLKEAFVDTENVSYENSFNCEPAELAEVDVDCPELNSFHYESTTEGVSLDNPSSETKTNAEVPRERTTSNGNEGFTCEAVDSDQTTKIKSSTDTNDSHGISRSPSSSESLSCKFCPRVFTRVSSLKSHLKTHGSLKPFSCKVCGKLFTKNHQLLKHSLSHACKRFSSNRDVRKFVGRKTNDDSSKKFQKCAVCKVCFSDSDSLNDHLRSYPQHVIKCKTCGKEFRDQPYLKVHRRIHTNEKPYGCEVCGKRFAQCGNYITHRRIHSGEKPYVCDFCDKRFASSGNRDSHRMTHTGTKPFMCDVCGKSFSRPNSLKTHRRTHTGEKPYACDLCRKCFVSSGKLADHRRTHTGEKPFTCDVCGVPFATKNTFRRHAKIHSGVRPHRCTICATSFLRLEALKNHLKTHKKEAAPSGHIHKNTLPDQPANRGEIQTLNCS